MVWTSSRPAGLSGVPVLVFTGPDRRGDKVEALDAGADDYLIAVRTAELLARVRAVCRRHMRDSAGATAIDSAM